MRLDKFLKVNKVIKRRTVAHDVTKAGLVKKDGRVLKPAYEVKPGDVLEVSYGTRRILLRVTDELKCEILADERVGGDRESVGP